MFLHSQCGNFVHLSFNKMKPENSLVEYEKVCYHEDTVLILVIILH